MSDPGAAAPNRTRVIVSDDGTTIRLTTYPAGITEPLSVCELSPEAAVQLAAELSSAASLHLNRRRNGLIGVRRAP